MRLNFLYTQYIDRDKSFFLVKVPIEYYIKDTNYRSFDEFSPKKDIQNTIKEYLGSLSKSRYPPIPIVFILKCNSAVIKKLSSLSNVCKKKNGDFIVTPKDDGDIGDFVYEMLTVKPAVFYKSIKPWTHVNVDLD